MFDRTSTQGRWLQSQHAHNERPRHRSQWFGMHAVREEDVCCQVQYQGLFESVDDCITDRWLSIALATVNDPVEYDIGGES